MRSTSPFARSVVPAVARSRTSSARRRTRRLSLPLTAALLAAGTPPLLADTDGETRPEREIVLLSPDFPDLRATVLTSAASDDPPFVTLVDPPAYSVAKLDNHGMPLFFRRDDQEVFDFRHHALTGEYSHARRTSGLEHTAHHEFLTLPDELALMMAHPERDRDGR